MKYVSHLICLCIFVLSVPLSLDAGERMVKRYRIDERSVSQLEQSPYLLTVTSGDLVKYPRSVVTFVVSTERGRSPSSIIPNDPVSAKRHYSMMSKDEFGHAGTPQVIFDREAGTVFIGFVGGKEGKKYFFKELPPVPEIAQHQMRQRGIPDSQ